MGALEVRGLSKSYPGTKALDCVDLSVGEGEIHALLGGNGSGKSTLVKVLAGVYQADAGQVRFGSTTVDARVITPADADAAECRFVHQQDSGMPGMCVTENLFAGAAFPRNRLGGISWKSAHRAAEKLLARYGINAEPTADFSSLRPATQQMICIARALRGSGDATGAVVLDEPTAALPPEESKVLRGALRRLADAGHPILYISHRLDELPGFADHATVLKDGRVVGVVDADHMDNDHLVNLITGGLGLAAGAELRPAPDRGAEVALAVDSLAVGPVRDASITVCSGEILGICGLAGSGRSTLLRCIFGELTPESGTVELYGRTPGNSIAAAVHAGVALVPENRLEDAAFVHLRLDENILAASLPAYARFGVLDYRSAERDAAELRKSFLVKARSLASHLSTLSGGNQQKAIMARWMHRKPKLLLLDEPTQGVDVGARAELHAQIHRAAADGCAVVVVSSDIDELVVLCDRVVGMVRGRTTDTIERDNLNEDMLERLAYGRAVAS
jgi:ribose transport system ATP-binding protein